MQEEYVKISLDRYEGLKNKEKEVEDKYSTIISNYKTSNQEMMKVLSGFFKQTIPPLVSISDSDNNNFGNQFNLYLKHKGYSLEVKGDTFVIIKNQ